jgi:hypothetical protein
MERGRLTLSFFPKESKNQGGCTLVKPANRPVIVAV